MRAGSCSSSRACLKPSLRLSFAGAAAAAASAAGFGATSACVVAVCSRDVWPCGIRDGPWRSQSLYPPTYSPMRPSPPSCITRVEVTTLSRKSRSWLTSSRVPGWSACSSSSSPSVSMSRSLVGSSITSRLDGCANSLASSSRLRSPPDSRVIGARAFGGEQEVLQIADHVLALAADLDELQPLGDVFQRVPVLAQRRAVLVEVGHLQLGADADLAGLRLQVAQQQLEQGGLAAAVGADQADAVAANRKSTRMNSS